MKKILLALLMVAAAVMPASAGIFKYGVEGGVNVNKMKVSSAFDSDNQMGWFIGPKIQLTVPGTGLNIDAALQYSQSKLLVDYSSDESSATVETVDKKLPFVVVPVNLKYAIGLGSYAAVYVSTGPQWNWYVGDKTFKTLTADDFSMERSTMSWNVGVGLHLLKHLQVGATYTWGIGKDLTEVYNQLTSEKTDKWKNNMWQIRVAYMF